MPVKPKTGPAVQERPERLAVALFDLDRIEPSIRKMILGGKLDLSVPFRVDAWDVAEDTMVPFSCPLIDAASICDVVRDRDRRAGDPPTRVAVFKQTWQRLSGTVLLTVMVKGKVTLNPAAFAGVRIEAVPTRARAVAW